MSTLWVRHTASSAAVARTSVLAAFADAGLSEDEAYEAALIASELVANAVRHATALPSGHLVVKWTIAGGEYLIAVTDGGSRTSAIPCDAHVTDVSGRGLTIIEALSISWGVAPAGPNDASITVWARGRYNQYPAQGRRLHASH